MKRPLLLQTTKCGGHSARCNSYVSHVKITSEPDRILLTALEVYVWNEAILNDWKCQLRGPHVCYNGFISVLRGRKSSVLLNRPRNLNDQRQEATSR
jgi:hypothetical protein